MMRKLYLAILLAVLSFVFVGCVQNEPKTVKISEPQTIQASPEVKVQSTEPNKPQASTIEGGISKNFVTNEYHPIVFGFKDENGFFSNTEVLGGSKGNKWFKVTDFDIKGKYVKPEDFLKGDIKENFVDINLVKGGETFKFYSEDKLVATEKGMKPTLTISPANGEKILGVSLTSLKVDDNFIIGVNGEWNALPRIPKILDQQKTFAIDLDGDGKDEVIRMKVSNTANESGQKDSNSGMTNIETVVQKDSNEVLVSKTSIDGEYTKNFKVITLDLNGDGKLEILTVESGHNMSISAYEVEKDKAKMVLHYYNGD